MLQSLKKTIRNQNETVLDLMAGIIIAFVVFEIVGLIFTQGKFRFCIGVLIGTVTAVVKMLHLYSSLEKQAYMAYDDAVKYARRNYIFRYLFMAVVLFICLKLSMTVFVGACIGILTLKVSVYLQPLIHKHITEKFISKGR